MLSKTLILSITLCSILSCETSRYSNQDRKKLAEKFFKSEYAGDTSQIQLLVSKNVVSTYPVFKQLFGTNAIQGRQSLKKFASGFSKHWIDGKITIHEAIEEDKTVVLVWSFTATRSQSGQDSSAVPGQKYSWGGITLFHFDESGKITQEIGEESTPGPTERLKPESISE